jgi:4-amino-4-deoxy-L-arabinose transferase-like glycosyltransferase
MHEAIRLASGLWVALALTGLYYAGRELYGQESAAASPMLLAGCLGLLFHAHDAQPMLIAVAAYTGALGGLAAIGRKPRLTGIFYGLAIAVCALGCGIAPTIPLLLLAPLACWLSPDPKKAIQTVLIGLLFAALLILPWPLLLAANEPERLASWLASELKPLHNDYTFAATKHFISLLPWFAFPALPLAAWTLWLRRKALFAPQQLLPLAFFVLTLLIVPIAYIPGEIPALLFLPSLALLATPGALAMRRGAANAFDWFAMTTMSLFSALVWLAWTAMALGWPQQLAQRVIILRPGFVGQFQWTAFIVGLLATLYWAWLIFTAPRSPYRSLTHWTLGFTTFWLLATSLILPWFDYGKSYRPVAMAVANTLPDSSTCLAERDLTDTQRASLAYFVGLEAVAIDSKAGRHCNWVLVTGDTKPELAAPEGKWIRVWEGSRPGDHQEKFRLYRRQ